MPKGWLYSASAVDRLREDPHAPALQFRFALLHVGTEPEREPGALRITGGLFLNSRPLPERRGGV